MTVPELKGRVLGGAFEVERLLGEGGFGAVYVASHVRTGKRYAVKVMHDERGGKSAREARERFRREADALAALGHPGIVAIHDFAQTDDGIDYLVMDLLSGEDLATRMQRVGRLPLPEALEIARQVGTALAAAHRAGILHRDLKPANVFLASTEGAPERAVILDFGLAKFADTSSNDHLTVSGLTMGTPLYMSPEQAMGAPVDQRTDIYALATMFYEIAAGETPFEAPTIPALMVKIMTAPPPPLSWRVPVAAHIDEALARAMKKDPAERFADVTSFLFALEGHSGAQTQAARPSAAPRTSDAPLAGGLPATRDGVLPALPETRDGARPVSPSTTPGAPVAAPTSRSRAIPLTIGALGIFVAFATLAWVAIVRPDPSEPVVAAAGTAPPPASESPADAPQPGVVEPGVVEPGVVEPGVVERQEPLDLATGDVAPGDETTGDETTGDETTGDETTGDEAVQNVVARAPRAGRRPPSSAPAAPVAAVDPAPTVSSPLPAHSPATAGAVPTGGGVTPALAEAYRAQIQSYEHQIREIEGLIGALPSLRSGIRGLGEGREPALCRSGAPSNLGGSRDVPIVVSTAQTLRNEVDRICEPFRRVHTPPPEVQRQLQTIDSTLSHALRMAQDRTVSTNTPPEVASQVEAAIGEAQRVLSGVPEGRKPFPCDAPVFARLRQLTTAGNVWSGAAAQRVVRLRDGVCNRLGVDRAQLERNERQFQDRLDSTEGALRQTQRTFQRLVDQYQALLP